MARLELTDLTFIPVSALEGDNVTHPSEKWIGIRAAIC